MSERPRILLVTADELVAGLFAELLPSRGFELTRVPTLDAAYDSLKKTQCDVLMVEDAPQGIDALAVLWWARHTLPQTEVVVVASHSEAARVLECERHGAYDFLSLPLESMDLAVQTLLRAAAKRSVVRDNERLTSYLREADAQIDAVNQDVERLVAERAKQLTYLSQANAQIDAMNQEMARLITERGKQIGMLEAANHRIERMNQELEVHVAERTRQLTEANAKLHELTMTDDLTGLYNQRWLLTRLGEEFARAQRHNLALAVLMLDLDRFKEVNDSHGHIFGSAVLRRVGDVLKQGVRGIDVAVRYGGDEFCVVLPQTTLPGAVAVAERLRATIARSDVGEPNEPVKVTISIGVSALGECEATDARGLLLAADKALYAAKEQGRNRVVGVTAKGTIGITG